MAQYGWTNFNPTDFTKRMNQVVNGVRKIQKKFEFDLIAVSGSSGCAAGFIVAHELKLPIVYIGKGEPTHGGQIKCNTELHHFHKYLIIDDFIDSGSTVRHIITEIDDFTHQYSRHTPGSNKCVGVMCYSVEEDAGESYVDVLLDEKIHLRIPVFNQCGTLISSK